MTVIRISSLHAIYIYTLSNTLEISVCNLRGGFGSQNNEVKG